MRVAPVLLTVSCASAAPAPNLVDDGGWNASKATTPAAAPSAVHPRPLPSADRPPYPANLLVDLAQVGPPRPSEHLGGDLEQTVWINEAASAYRQLLPTTVFPPGSVVVARHHPPSSPEIVAVYVMRKGADGWSFAVLDPSLRRVTQAPLEACARCHAEAPYDGVFGPAVSPEG